jgi:hypothetical protein
MYDTAKRSIYSLLSEYIFLNRKFIHESLIFAILGTWSHFCYTQGSVFVQFSDLHFPQELLNWWLFVTLSFHSKDILIRIS